MSLTKQQVVRLKKLSEALRSGKYSQTTQLLRRGDSFCCLGVACDLHVKSTKHNQWRHPGTTSDVYMFGADLYSIPKSIQDYYGFNSNVGTYIKAPQAVENFIVPGRTLISLNDREGRDFKFIAKVIDLFIEQDGPAILDIDSLDAAEPVL